MVFHWSLILLQTQMVVTYIVSRRKKIYIVPVLIFLLFFLLEPVPVVVYWSRETSVEKTQIFPSSLLPHTVHSRILPLGELQLSQAAAGILP